MNDELDNLPEAPDTGSHPMSWQYWHEIAESSDKSKEPIKSNGLINYVIWKSETVNKQVAQRFYYKRNVNNQIIEYSSSLHDFEYNESVPTYTFQLVE